jgi:hypothetical protein
MTHLLDLAEDRVGRGASDPVAAQDVVERTDALVVVVIRQP